MLSQLFPPNYSIYTDIKQVKSSKSSQFRSRNGWIISYLCSISDLNGSSSILHLIKTNVLGKHWLSTVVGMWTAYFNEFLFKDINLNNCFNSIPHTSYISSVFYLFQLCGEGIYRAVLLCKVVELQSCQKELTHAKLAHRPSGYSNWNVSRVCCDLSQHRKWSTAATSSSSSKPVSQSYCYLQRWPFQTRRSGSSAADSSNGNFDFVMICDGEVVPLRVPRPGLRLVFHCWWTNTEFFSVWRFAPTHQNAEVLEVGNVSNLINAVLQTGLSGFPRHVVTVLAALLHH